MASDYSFERDRAPRVALVAPAYLPESYGGAEQQTRRFAHSLGRLGSRVTLLAPRLKASTSKRESDLSLQVKRFRLRHAPNLGGRHLPSFALWGLKLTTWLWWHRREYDVIHVIHGRLHAVPAVLAGALLGKPTVVKLGRGGIDHFDLDLVSRKKFFGPGYVRALVQHVTGYVANSRQIADDLRRWGVEDARIAEIPNGVEVPAYFESVPATDGTVRFIAVGRLDAEKAIDQMIRGFSRLANRERAHLTIVGDGACRATLENLVDELGVRPHVTFTGALSSVTAELCRADVYLSTSLSEGMSNALLEAMSFGLMPVISEVSGAADIIDEGRSGLLFPCGNEGALLRALERALALTAEERRAMGQRARETMLDRFQIDQVARRHLELYRKLMAHNGPEPLYATSTPPSVRQG